MSFNTFLQSPSSHSYQYLCSVNVSRRHEYELKGGPKSSFLLHKQGFLVRSISVPFPW